MKNYPLIVLSIIISFSFFSCKKEKFPFTIESMIETVKVISEKGERVPELGAAVIPGETIVTGEKSMCDLLYGAIGVLRIKDNSTVNIAVLEEKIAGNAELTLENGIIFTTMAKLSKNTEFRIKTHTTVVAVRGTSYRVSSDEKTKSSRLDVIDGEVEVKPVKNGKVIHQAAFRVGKGKAVSLDSKRVDVIAYKVDNKIPLDANDTPIVKLQKDEMKKLKGEMKDIKPSIMKKLNPDVQGKLKNSIKSIKKPKLKKPKVKFKL